MERGSSKYMSPMDQNFSNESVKRKDSAISMISDAKYLRKDFKKLGQFSTFRPSVLTPSRKRKSAISGDKKGKKDKHESLFQIRKEIIENGTIKCPAFSVPPMQFSSDSDSDCYEYDEDLQKM